MAAAFYKAGGGEGEFVATALTRGPWDPGAQHAGPPAALLGRAIEGLAESERFQIARLTFEILRSVPIGPVAVTSRVLRPGRRVRLVEAELRAGGEPLMRAAAWQIEIAAVEVPAEALVRTPPPPPPEAGAAGDFFPGAADEGYHTAMELSFASGRFMEIGPATAWLRMKVPLLEGEEPSPLQRTLVAADVGNGISAALDFREFVFVNVELTVHLERIPAGEWICVDAVTLPQPTGVATAESVLFDTEGRIGRAAQSLIVSRR
ncbi:MAG: thioesterase family protein [Solirubrobacterales bacterium]